MNGMSFQHYLLGLFAVANNIAAIPLFMNLIQERDKKEHLKLCNIATITSFITMIVSMFAGLAILNFFEISVPAFRIAGGLLLLSTGFNMLQSVQKSLHSDTRSFSQVISTAIIPIAIPLTTGAGTMTTVILFAEAGHDKPYLHFALLAAIIVMTLIIYLSFRYAPKIISLMGDTGLDVLTKIFGLITLALGIQFILTGIADAFPKIM